jgi:ABC-type phosphate/phosphonate transport system substrate-binding protein
MFLRQLGAFAVLGAVIAFAAAAQGQPAKVQVLSIGSTGTLTGTPDSAKEKAGVESLRRFIKEETGLDNEITGRQNWSDLTQKLSKGQYHLGVYQGYEFAWAQGKHPRLHALAVGVNGEQYPVARVLVKRDNPATNFAGLKGQELIAPATNQVFLHFFVERTCEQQHLKPGAFFSKITSVENNEDALDDVVDGKAGATMVDQATLEAYKQRKPGRFNQLREVARSQPFPPIVVAYYDSLLDETTREKFKAGLLAASRKPKGAMLLMLSHLSAFEAPPDQLGEVLAQTRKTYPAAE